MSLENINTPTYNMTNNKPYCYIFDLDNTLVDMNGRSPYDNNLSGDTPILSVLQIINMIDIWCDDSWPFDIHSSQRSIEIILLSWRKKLDFEKATRNWLDFNWFKRESGSNYIAYDRLILNDTDPCVSWPVFKAGKLIQLKEEYNILWVFDDDEKVMDICKLLWIPSFQFSLNTK